MSPEMREKIRQMYTAGATYKEIGAACGVGTCVIGCLVRDLPRRRRPRTKISGETRRLVRRLYSSGASYQKMMAVSGLSHVNVARMANGLKRRVPGCGRRVSSQTKEQVLAMHAAGVPSREIATSCSLRPGTVYRIVRRSAVVHFQLLPEPEDTPMPFILPPEPEP